MTEKVVTVTLNGLILGNATEGRREVHERGQRVGLLRLVKVYLR
jgi:hypothetical protein